MSKKVLVTTGAIIGRPNGRDYKLIEGFRKKLCCDGLEFMMYSTWQEERQQIVDYLVSTGIDFPTVHCQKGIGEDIAEGRLSTALSRFDGDCMMAEKIGAKICVLHLWNGPVSDSHMGRALAAVPKLISIAREHGVTVTFENVVCSGESPLEHLLQIHSLFPEASFTFDTKMAAFHNELQTSFEGDAKELWQGPVKHVHVNDYDGGYMEWGRLRTLPIGAGRIDFQSVFENLKNAGYNGDYTIEATAFGSDGKVDFDMLNDSVKKLRNLL
ncbi:MAG: sugar phosphate isomerase/epimerase [Lachnospiraceae bacterium]|nr:sugar phosphate isomerase/epimerase [Lachnospiraceae bacterium]